MSGGFLPRFGLKFTVPRALASGILLALAAPPWGWWPLAWFALVPLWSCLGQGGFTQALGLGMVAGTTYYLLLLQWLWGLHPLTWMGIGEIPSLGIAGSVWLLVSLFEGASWAVWAGLNGLGRNQPIGVRVLWGAGTWLLMEKIWASGPLGFPWGTLAMTQAQGWYVPLVQLGGASLLTGLVALVNGLVWAMLVGPLPAGFLALGLLGWAACWRGLPIESGPTKTIGILQVNISQAQRVALGPQRVMAIYTQAYQALAQQHPDLIITPEVAVTIRWDRAAQVNTPLGRALHTEKVPLLLGAYDQRGEQLSNSLFASGGGVYDKINLVPLNDTVPFKALFGPIVRQLSPIYGDLFTGSNEQIFDTALGRVGAGICYDSLFAEGFRGQVLRGARWLVTVTNDSWFGPAMPPQRHNLEILRAVENARWLVRVSNTGSSGVIDPLGRTIALTPRNEYVLLKVPITLQKQITPYTRWGEGWGLITGIGGFDKSQLK